MSKIIDACCRKSLCYRARFDNSKNPDFLNITVVVGYEKQQVMETLRAIMDKLRFVDNPRYAVDTNIGSLLLGLRDSDAPALVIEADIAFDDAAMKTITKSATGTNSVWFTYGRFMSHQLGGILRTDEKGRLNHLHYTPAYEPQYATYKKLVGVVYVGPREMPKFHALLRSAAAQTTAQYFMMPWCEHLDLLPAIEVDLGNCRVATFNTREDYLRCIELFHLMPTPCPAMTYSINFVDVADLRHIEGFSRRRVKWLAEKVLREGIWTTPLALEKAHHLVMDGQHRMEVARELGLLVVPAILFSYEDVEVWSLRPGKYDVTGELVIQRSLSGDIYPYKTAKHRFPVDLPKLSIPLNELLEGRTSTCG